MALVFKLVQAAKNYINHQALVLPASTHKQAHNPLPHLASSLNHPPPKLLFLPLLWDRTQNLSQASSR